MKIYKNGKQIFNGKQIAIDKVAEMGTNDLLVDIHDDGRKKALRIERNCALSRITLCEGEEIRIDSIIGDVFVKTWSDGLFPKTFMLNKGFLSEIKTVMEATQILKWYSEHIILV